ncbi:hypothetical protein B0I35DRAFT_442544 [Stachybotrys elegans]|uniref:DUF4604 domain-containing protein n=1 Tax=Stachybotrys elegans TaxID=80388 RepID=A0A8K0SK95_9HYPO|nr:hypothetical protein B0I35DRAFT_442544 [Stachybotrys elegans]
MSEKITSKNLSYDTSLPPFLAALRAQASGATGPDPLLAAHRRAVKKRSGSEEAEDAPLIVDENGNTVTLELDQDGEVKKQDATTEEKEEHDAKVEKKDEKSAIGARKRKVGKVVGEAADDNKSNDSKADKTVPAEPPKDKKVKKKAKKIKLSFDEDT